MATASNEFELIGPSDEECYNPSAVTLSCRLSPEISAVNMEIRWFKETDCVCVYKNRQVTEGRRYEGRVSLFTLELERGNVSLLLTDCTESDSGDYVCQVTDGDRTEEITVEMIEVPEEEEEELGWDPLGFMVFRIDREWTEDERMKMKLSALQIERPSSEVTRFIPELSNDEYRFLCPHAGQFMCKLTNLMFEMGGKGEVLYRIVSWDSCLLDGSGQKEPAGPLYSITCHEGSIKYLHLPHCETYEVELTVAHVTGGNMEILQPFTVTNTHVIIYIQGLSIFGILRAISDILRAQTIKAQVLLFYKKMVGKHSMSKLHVHLLPGNVPVVEVRKQHESKKYVETSAICELIPGKKYRILSKNTDPEIKIQPEFEKFHPDYGPNYHPTFEVFFNTDVNKITLGLLDKNEEVVWEPRLILLTADTEAPSPESDITGAAFMEQHRETLIQKVVSVMEIADCLKSKDMISDEMYSEILVHSLTSQGQMRRLYRHLDSGGRAVKAEVYKIIKEKMPFIVDDLEAGSSSA